MTDISVIKRDGSVEDFDIDKISNSIMSAAMMVGGEDSDLADELADMVVDFIESNDIEEIESSDIQNIVEKTLIEEGHAATAKVYILKAADRNRMREMDTDLMKSFEEITFKSEEESEIKRENANIDSSTAMGTMLKYGSEAAKKFNLLYMMSEDIAAAHKNGDIHIHDLDFLTLTETCIGKDTLLTVKINNNTQVIMADELEMICNINNCDVWHHPDNMYVLSDNKYVKVNGVVKHSALDKKVMNIVTKTGTLTVTDNHVVTTLVNGNKVDKKASDIQLGDVLSVPNINLNIFNQDKLDIINEYHGENLVIDNTFDVILNIKNNNKWKEFCSIFDYRDSRSLLIRSNKAKLTIPEYRSIEHLSTIKHEDLNISYKRSRQKESIKAVIDITFELGNIIGLMYSEGSITEHIDKRQESHVKQACFCNYDEDLIEQFNDNYSKVFNNAHITDREHNGKHTGSILYGYLQYELFHGVFGYKNSTDDIRLARWMFNANKQFVSGLLAGIIDGDGCVQNDGYRVNIASVSEGFLKDIQKLLLLRGIKSSIKSLTGAEEGTSTIFINDGKIVESIRNFNNYTLEITGDLENKLSWINSNKINTIDLRSSDKFPDKYVTVKDIYEIEYSGFVYDLETEDNHFTADGFNVHNCCQIPIDRLFRNGFNTGHGFVREPAGIRSAGGLTAIAIQSNQNDQHGGQSIPLFDYYLAPYVSLTFVKEIANIWKLIYCDPDRHILKKKKKSTNSNNKIYKNLKSMLVSFWESHFRFVAEPDFNEHHSLMTANRIKEIKELIIDYFDKNDVKISGAKLNRIINLAYAETYEQTFQSMEAFIANLNTMHSRAGAQTPFSSINYGTDTSVEGRMIIETLLKTTSEGLGNGETPIFPIQIFKLKDGVSFKKGDPNYDLKILAEEVSAKRLYPNFDNLDASYNKGIYKEGCPETEVAYMGCVESSEIIRYKIDDVEMIDTFSEAYNNVFKHVGKSEKYSENSEYIDSTTSNIYVFDSSSNRYVSVEKFIKNTNVKNFRVVTFNNGYSITLTGDHPLPVVNKGRTYVDDLEIGDQIKVANVANSSGNILSTNYFGNSLESAWLLGILITDSSYANNICISLALDEQDIIAKINSTVEKLGATTRIVEQHRGQKGDYYDVFINNLQSLKDARIELNELFGGKKKIYRRLTTKLLSLNKEYREALLAGLIDGDGHVTTSSSHDGNDRRSARFSIGSTNKALALTELYLIRSLGIRAKLIRNKYSSNHNKIRYIIEFEIVQGVINNMACNKKIQIANSVDNCKFSDTDTINVVSISNNAEENEINDISYDVETKTDRFDVSFIQSHNCRTRVATNIYDPDKTVIPGRGNLSFTSINLPRLGIKAQGNIAKFYALLDDKLELVHKQLLERFEIQCKKHPKNYPFLMGQGNWLGSDKLGPDDDIREILKHGTLTVGFIGLAETLKALIGKHHGESEEAQKLGIEIIQHMRDYTDAWSIDEHMNYSLIGTPAEGLSGRFVRLDKKLYGSIPGVTDRDYYTNSSHVPVYYPISAFKKIEIEAPYHRIENGGHILYIEIDGDPSNNIKAFDKIVDYMHDKNAGYFSINHPVDRDPVCGYVGIIGDKCPRCGRSDKMPMTQEMFDKLFPNYKGGRNMSKAIDWMKQRENSDTLGVTGNQDEEADRTPLSIYGDGIAFKH